MRKRILKIGAMLVIGMFVALMLTTTVVGPHPVDWIVGGNPFGGGTSQNLGHVNNDDLVIITGNTQRIFVDGQTGSGHVGIGNPQPVPLPPGISFPAARLHVDDNPNIAVNTYTEVGRIGVIYNGAGGVNDRAVSIGVYDDPSTAVADPAIQGIVQSVPPGDSGAPLYINPDGGDVYLNYEGGKVGIGTNDLDAALDIKSYSTHLRLTVQEDTGTNTHIYTDFHDWQGDLMINPVNKVNGVVDWGNVGILDAYPARKLTVREIDTNYDSVTPTLRLIHTLKEGTSNANVNFGTGIEFELQSYFGSSVTGIAAAIDTIWTKPYMSDMESKLRFKTLDGNDDGLSIRLVIDKDGLVGIGVVDPTAALDVQTDITASSGSAKGVNFEQTLTAGADNDKLNALYIKPTFTDGGYSGVEHNGIIVESGNVGIGVTSPKQKLNVDGKVGIGYNDASQTAQLHVDTSTKYAGYFTSNKQSSDTHVIHAEYTYTGPGGYGAKAVYGKSAPENSVGYGGYFEGGFMGAYGECAATNLGVHYGLKGKVTGSLGTTNIGVQGEVTQGAVYCAGIRGESSSSTSQFNYGVHGIGSGTSSVANYGVYGSASGSSGIDWAGYFGSGNVYVTNNLGIGTGTTTITGKLDINGNDIRIRISQTPATSTSSGNAGEIAWDSDFIYVCTATDYWERVAISHW